MRCILAIFLGLVALGQVQARAVSSDGLTLSKRTAELDYTHLSDYPLDDARNDGLTQRSPEVEDSSLSEHALNDLPKQRLAIRIAAGGTPPVPKPAPPPQIPGLGKPGSRLRTGRPNANEEPDNVAMAIERVDLSDTSDIVKVSPCGAAKRGLEDLELDGTLRPRMSGDEKALTWDEWQEVLEDVDEELATLSRDELALHQKIRIIFMGGISGVAFNSRGEGGRTGDVDFSFDTSTPKEVRDIFLKAVDQMVARKPGKFETILAIGKPDPINDQWDKHAGDGAKEALTRESRLVAWEGNYFTALHGDWRMQLISKMNRIAEWRSRSTEFKEKDQQDAKLFLQKVRQLPAYARTLDMNDFVAWGSMLGWDREQTEALTKVSMKIVTGDNMPGIAQAIKDAVNRMKC